MRIGVADQRRARGWEFIVTGLLVVVGLLAIGCSRFEDRHQDSSEARRIAESTSVTGFARTAVVDMSDGDNPSNAQAFFIGPAPKPDPTAAVSVPTIPLTTISTPPPISYDGVSYPVAKGKRPDGCMATVVFESNPKSVVRSTVSNDLVTIVTPAQLDALRGGTQVLIRLNVSNCGR